MYFENLFNIYVLISKKLIKINYPNQKIYKKKLSLQKLIIVLVHCTYVMIKFKDK